MHHEHSSRFVQAKATLALVLAALASAALGQGTVQFHIDQVVEFKPGTPKARAMLARVPSLRDLITDPFRVATVDLNDDGRKEILVMGASSSYCGSGGCLLVVLEQQGNKMVTLLNQNVPNSLAVTQEKIGAYRALAALDAQGSFAVADKPGAPMHGKAMVYGLGGAHSSLSAAGGPASSGDAGLAGVGTTTRSQGTPAGAEKLDVVGIKIGMPAEQAESRLRVHNPKFKLVTEQTTFTDLHLTAQHALRALGGFEGSGTPDGDAEEILLGLALPPHASGVTEIVRVVRFPNARRPTTAAVLASLQAKYGQRFETLDLNQVERLHVWRLDGKPADKPLHACYRPDRQAALKRGDDVQAAMQMQDFRNLMRHAERCGVFAAAVIDLDHKNEQIATGFRLRVTSEPFRAESLKSSIEYLRSRNEVRKSGEASKAGNAKVKM